MIPPGGGLSCSARELGGGWILHDRHAMPIRIGHTSISLLHHIARKPAVQRAQEAQEIEMIDMSLHLQRNKLIDVVVSGAGLSHGTCIQKPDHQLVEVGHELGDKNAYYLPWENGGCTEAMVTLEAPLKYFFTAPLSGCSLWCKYLAADRIVIRHEARTQSEHHNKHRAEGFVLVFDSHEARKADFDDCTLKIEQSEGQIRKLAIDFMVYAAVERIGMTFYVQERRTRSTTNARTNHKTEARELVRELGIPVLPQ